MLFEIIYVSSGGDPLIKTLVHRLSALLLVPIEHLNNLWLIIECKIPENNQKMEEFLNYFVKIWLVDLTPRFALIFILGIIGIIHIGELTI